MKIPSVTSSLAALTLLALCTPTMAQSDAVQALDIQTKGPYAQRPFARAPGAQIVVQNATPPAIPGNFISDPKTGETNELIVLLNYDSFDRLSALIPGLVRGTAAPIVERGFLEAINSGQSNAAIAFGYPANSRPLLATGRMSDAERAKQVKLLLADGKGGFGPNPREQLERYMVLRYDSIAQAKAQLARLKADAAVGYLVNNGTVTGSATPNDPYFSNNGTPPQYQWGLHAMNFATAWDSTRGQAYVGVLDAGWPGTVVGNTFAVHPDLQENFRQQMMAVAVSVTAKATLTGNYVADPDNISANHSVHVSGIISATHNNKSNAITLNGGNGAIGAPSNGATAGACPECSFVSYPFGLANHASPWSVATLAAQLVSSVDAGMQVINWSGGYRGQNVCQYTYGSPDVICAALWFATNRGVLVLISSGNDNNVDGTLAPLANGPQFPGNLHDGSAESFSVLPVGGTLFTGLRWVAPADIATKYPNEAGANFASVYGVSAPARTVVSTFNNAATYWTVLGFPMPPFGGPPAVHHSGGMHQLFS